MVTPRPSHVSRTRTYLEDAFSAAQYADNARAEYCCKRYSDTQEASSVLVYVTPCRHDECTLVVLWRISLRRPGFHLCMLRCETQFSLLNPGHSAA